MFYPEDFTFRTAESVKLPSGVSKDGWVFTSAELCDWNITVMRHKLGLLDK